jgi:hypothetical protein
MPSFKLAAAALVALALIGCSQSGDNPPKTITIQDVQADIKKACNFVPTISSIVAVASTIVTSIDPAAGAAATIAAAVGNTVTKAICDAVTAQTGDTTKASAPKPGSPITVTVNGKPVTGTIANSDK